jgi:hypothetical protein
LANKRIAPVNTVIIIIIIIIRIIIHIIIRESSSYNVT